MMIRPPQLAVVVAIALCQVDVGAECTQKPRNPVKVAGPFCGKVFDIALELQPDTELGLYDLNDVLVAEVRADSNADFRFPPLSKGSYRLRARDWTITSDRIEIMNSSASTCKHPVTVYVGLPYPDCSGGWVSKKWDYRHFPDGPPSRK
jgi:hypothetical protein